MMKSIFIALLFALTTGVAVNAQQQERPGPQPAPETGEKIQNWNGWLYFRQIRFG